MTDIYDEYDAPRENRHKFGKLNYIMNYVRTQSGASYMMEGINNKDGTPRLFKGKVLAEGKGNKVWKHVILDLVCRAQDGTEYHYVRDDLSFSDSMSKISAPSLQKVFGPKYQRVVHETTPYVEIELVPSGTSSTGKELTAFRVIRKFANEEEYLKAEHDYFAKFGASNGDENGWVTEGTIEKAVAFWKDTCGGSEEVFRSAAPAVFPNVPLEKLVLEVKWALAPA